MTTHRSHLSEDERHASADGTLPDAERTRVQEHLAACAECAADVARIERTMHRIRDRAAEQSAHVPVDELWPSVRARIEELKVVPLAAEAPVARRNRRLGWWIAGAAASVAAVLIANLAMHDRGPTTPEQSSFTIVDTGGLLRLASDSAQVLERESKILLDRLELQRAMLRPDALAALDHDLRVVDAAIAELKDAVARDPSNPALRRLLAASYRQKVDLLKRAANAS